VCLHVFGDGHVSPIQGLQPRLPEAGRIRIGQQVEVEGRPGHMRPDKLDHFRFTSHDPIALETIAKRYGGTVQTWVGGHGPDGAFEVLTDAHAIDVYLPPSGLAFSQWYEEWSGAGCMHRCDGEFDDIGGTACSCDPKNRECKATTRLSLILDGLIGTGVWVLSSRGYNAAAELAGTVAIAEHVDRPGRLVPARLLLEQRTSNVAGQPTRHFAVPRLDLSVSLLELTGAAPRPALEQRGPASAPAELTETTAVMARVRARVRFLGIEVQRELVERWGEPEHLTEDGWRMVEAYLNDVYPITPDEEDPF
jgi:hypothetical protein